MTIQTQDITVNEQLSGDRRSSGDRPSILNNNLLNRRGLTSNQYVILRELLRLRTATLSRFEIETNRLGQGIGQELEGLEKAGWVESQVTGSTLEPKVYYLSAKAIKLLLFPEDN
jgi:DNA-binding MarR family transcriptional regulator